MNNKGPDPYTGHLVTDTSPLEGGGAQATLLGVCPRPEGGRAANKYTRKSRQPPSWDPHIRFWTRLANQPRVCFTTARLEVTTRLSFLLVRAHKYWTHPAGVGAQWALTPANHETAPWAWNSPPRSQRRGGKSIIRPLLPKGTSGDDRVQIKGATLMDGNQAKHPQADNYNAQIPLSRSRRDCIQPNSFFYRPPTRKRWLQAYSRTTCAHKKGRMHNRRSR